VLLVVWILAFSCFCFHSRRLTAANTKALIFLFIKRVPVQCCFHWELASSEKINSCMSFWFLRLDVLLVRVASSLLHVSIKFEFFLLPLKFPSLSVFSLCREIFLLPPKCARRLVLPAPVSLFVAIPSCVHSPSPTGTC
jgi:hypothetical protein